MPGTMPAGRTMGQDGTIAGISHRTSVHSIAVCFSLIRIWIPSCIPTMVLNMYLMNDEWHFIYFFHPFPTKSAVHSS